MNTPLHNFFGSLEDKAFKSLIKLKAFLGPGMQRLPKLYKYIFSAIT